MIFVPIFWKNNVPEAYLPKMSISGQIVPEIVAQLCLENPIQTLLIFFWVDPPKKIILWVQCKPGSRKFSIIVMLSTKKKKNKTKQQDINTTTTTTTTITGRTEVTEKWSYSLCLENGWTYAWLGWPRKMAFPSSEGDVKIVSSNIALVLNTLTLK